MDELSTERMKRLLQSFKTKHGHDPTERDLIDAGFTQAEIKKAVKAGIAVKYQVKTGKGQVENRFKLGIARDTWLKSL